MNLLGDYRFLAGGGYLTSALCLLLAILVFHANPQSKSCRLTALFNGSIAMWAFFFGSHFIAGNGNLGLLCARFFSLGTILLSVFLTHFVVVETKKETSCKRFLTVNYAVSALIAAGLFVPELILSYPVPKMGLPSYAERGPLYSLLPLQLFFNLFFSLYLIFQALRRIKGFRKNQLKLFLFAIIVGYTTGTPGYLLAYDIPVLPTSAVLVSIVPFIISYAIIKHRFLDIDKLAKNTLIFSLLFIALMAVVSFVLFILKQVFSRFIGISEPAAQGIAIALAIGLYGPLKTGLSRLTNRLLFQHSPNPETIFTALSEDIMHDLDTQKLAGEVTARIAQILALDRIGFYVRSRTHGSISAFAKRPAPLGDRQYSTACPLRAEQRQPAVLQKFSYMFELRASLGRLRKKQIHQSKQLIRYLENTKDFLVNPHTEQETRLFLRRKPAFALANVKEVRKQAAVELAALGGVAAFPVFVKESLRAVLVIGRKKSDAPWRQEEFQILKSFMRHLSLALANAEYAEEIRRFRERLSLSERDASAGALIAGVHHEAGGMLHAMTLNLSNLIDDLENPEVLGLPRVEIEKLAAEIMEGVRRNVFKINSIIEHLSNLAERRPLTILEGVRPAEIAETVLREAAAENAGGQIRIHSRIPESLTLACDPNALYEIFANLIRNARQAIPEEGAITIDATAANGEVQITVQDTGVGIPKENRSRIFEPFYTTKKPKNGPPSGTGMGLFLAKQFMEGMGGRIEVESEPGKGTAFCLRFPNLEHLLVRAAG